MSRDRKPAPIQPNQFEIGRHTFFDFGPPTDYYEVFIVRPAKNGASIERITPTPPGNECVSPAKIETASGFINESPAELLGSTNLCAIPEKELRRELKRCKHCLVFSGANVVVQAQCGDKTRLIRADILDRDIYSPTPKTPEHTSWIMRLVGTLDSAIGPGVMEKPMFQIPQPDEAPQSDVDSAGLRDVGAGKYDALFERAPDKPSDLYRAARTPLSPPIARLVASIPVLPEVFVPPGYPPIARLARVEGSVSFTIDVDTEGAVTDPIIVSGHPLLVEAVKQAAVAWKFPRDTSRKHVHATVEFVLNCGKKKP